jgi:hypothetical protein
MQRRKGEREKGREGEKERREKGARGYPLGSFRWSVLGDRETEFRNSIIPGVSFPLPLCSFSLFGLFQSS